jgi:polar amino acid transport system substrate-binding protein
MRLGHLIMIFLMALLTVSPMLADDLRIDFDEAHPPYMYNKDGHAEGIYPALIKAAFTHMEVAVKLEPKPWARAISELNGGVAGVGGIYKNSERLKIYDYSEPLLVETITIYFHKAHPLAYARIEDLKGARIGVMRGWSYGDDFDKARDAGWFTVEGVGSDEQNFQKLESGRVDVVLAIGESVFALLDRYRDIRASEVPLIQPPAFLAFPKKANRVPLLKQFDQTIKAMKASGEFQKILAAELAR